MGNTEKEIRFKEKNWQEIVDAIKSIRTEVSDMCSFCLIAVKEFVKYEYEENEESFLLSEIKKEFRHYSVCCFFCPLYNHLCGNEESIHYKLEKHIEKTEKYAIDIKSYLN